MLLVSVCLCGGFVCLFLVFHCMGIPQFIPLVNIWVFSSVYIMDKVALNIQVQGRSFLNDLGNMDHSLPSQHPSEH